MKKFASLAVMLPVISAALLAAPPKTGAQTQSEPTAAAKYVPQAQLCADGKSALCSLLPAYIGPDPRLKNTVGYNGLYGAPPRQASEDVQTPFDNMAWQMFVALNWAANAVKQPTGLTAPGPRVWQTYHKVSALFGDSPVRAGCPQALALPKFYIGSDGKGTPAPNNEEYLQASTNLPLIDVNGNWTIFERRVNEIEAKYLAAPNGKPAQTLTTLTGQRLFIAANPGGADFTSSATTQTGNNGSIEIKASWRILDRNKGDDPSRYFTQVVFLAVSGDLVSSGRSFCKSVTVGLVGLHILQRNPVDPNNPALLPQWIWASFEHADNAPLAQSPCNVSDGCGTAKATDWINKETCGPAAAVSSVHYSYFKPNQAGLDTNIRPASPGGGKTAFPWSPQQPYAHNGTTPATAMPQATRCWAIYPTTDALNLQWRKALVAQKSVFAYYILVGTQWGGQLEPPTPPNPVPADAVPGMLSNITLETYIQNYTGSDKSLPGPGSCVSCHAGAPLPADGKTSANFSFLPLLADPPTARSRIKTAR